jgi:hypothetical protein
MQNLPHSQMYSTMASSDKRKLGTSNVGDGSVQQPSAKSCKTANDWQKELTTTETRFACPFYKKDADRFARVKACHGPGWTQLHRLKEHIKRCHTPAKHTCSRCCETFETEELLYQHQRADMQCPVRNADAMDGIMNPDQALSLKSRKKHVSDMTEPEKWHDIYHALFPLDDEDSYPSPYYDTETTVSSRTSAATIGGNELAEYKEYLAQSMTGDRQKQLEVELGNTLGISNPDLCKILAQKFRDHQLRELRLFEDTKMTYTIPDKELDLIFKENRGFLAQPAIHDPMTAPAALDMQAWGELGGDGRQAWDLI